VANRDLARESNVGPAMDSFRADPWQQRGGESLKHDALLGG
jgi:hypothetical protein